MSSFAPYEVHRQIRWRVNYNYTAVEIYDKYRHLLGRKDVPRRYSSCMWSEVQIGPAAPPRA